MSLAKRSVEAPPDGGAVSGIGRPARVAAMADLLDTMVQAATAYDAPTLAERLAATRAELVRVAVHVVVVGEFKQGKSSFINALLNTRVCPVDDDIATAVPTLVRHGDEPRATALLAQTDESDSVIVEQPISFDDVVEFATEAGTTQPVEGTVRGVEIALPRKLLTEGLVLVDTPGIGGLGSAHSTAALGALSLADAVIVASDASQELTAAEIQFIEQATSLCSRVLCVSTKTDLYPAWRKVRELNEDHLRAAHLEVGIVPVSSALRTEAARRSDRELNAESGFGEVLRWLSESVLDTVVEERLVNAGADIRDGCDELTTYFANERASLADPANADELVRSLRSAAEDAERLRSKAARWNLSLSDGITDLSADLDFDFKNRIRRLTSEADAVIDGGDPLDTWAEFEPWLTNRVSNEVVANYHLLAERTDALAELVGDHFDEVGSAVLERVAAQSRVSTLTAVEDGPSLDISRPKAATRGLTLLRNSYSGVLMFTVLGSMVGIALTPVALGVGLLMGRKGLKDEKDRQLTQRRSQAKVALRQYCDEVSFKVSKDSRDSLRQIHRELRDHYSDRADELHRSASRSLAVATEAEKADHRQRQQRIADIDAELERLQKVLSAVDGFVHP